MRKMCSLEQYCDMHSAASGLVFSPLTLTLLLDAQSQFSSVGFHNNSSSNFLTCLFATEHDCRKDEKKSRTVELKRLVLIPLQKTPRCKI